MVFGVCQASDYKCNCQLVDTYGTRTLPLAIEHCDGVQKKEPTSQRFISHNYIETKVDVDERKQNKKKTNNGKT